MKQIPSGEMTRNIHYCPQSFISYANDKTFEVHGSPKARSPVCREVFTEAEVLVMGKHVNNARLSYHYLLRCSGKQV